MLKWIRECGDGEGGGRGCGGRKLMGSVQLVCEGGCRGACWEELQEGEEGCFRSSHWFFFCVYVFVLRNKFCVLFSFFIERGR